MSRINEIIAQIRAIKSEQVKVHLRAIHPEKDTAINFIFDNTTRTIDKHSGNGYNIYLTVNNGGTLTEDITECTALFIEFDHITREEQWEKVREKIPYEPSLVVDTGGKSLHFYWIFASPLTDTSLWLDLQARLIKFTGADKANKDLPRVMRLAGTKHQTTGEYSFIVQNNKARYTAQQFDQLLPKLEPLPQPTIMKPISFEPVSGGVDLMRCLPLECRDLIQRGARKGERNNIAVRVARDLIGNSQGLDKMGVRYSPTAYELFLEFCQRCDSGDGWDYTEWEKVWHSAMKSNPQGMAEERLLACVKAQQPKPRPVVKPKTPAPKQPQNNDYRQIYKRLVELSQRNLVSAKRTTLVNNLSKETGWQANELAKILDQIMTEQGEEFTIKETISEWDNIEKAETERLELTDYLPDWVAEELTERANLLSLRPECYLTALLIGVSSMHNPKTKVWLSRRMGFKVAPNLYGGIIAVSSQKKSPILSAMILDPLRSLQNKLRTQWEEQMQDYVRKSAQYDRLKLKLRGKDGQMYESQLERDFPQGRPKEPKQPLFLFTNATTEGIQNQVEAYPDYGLLYFKDELAGFFKGMNQYRNGKGSDEEDMLSFYDATSATLLRANGTSVDVDNVLLSVVGSIQPTVLRELMGDGEDGNGKWARFIFVHQPTVPSVMPETDEEVSYGAVQAIYDLIAEQRNTGLPIEYNLTAEAYQVLREEVNRLEEERTINDTAMSYVYGKAEGRIGKIAANLKLLSMATYTSEWDGLIDANTMHSAIKLSQFYCHQMRTFYLESNNDALTIKILAMLRKHGRVTVTEVRQGLSRKQRQQYGVEQVRQTMIRLGLTDRCHFNENTLSLI